MNNEVSLFNDARKKEAEDAACPDLNATKTERTVVVFVASRTRRKVTTSQRRSNNFFPLLLFQYYEC